MNIDLNNLNPDQQAFWDVSKKVQAAEKNQEGITLTSEEVSVLVGGIQDMADYLARMMASDMFSL